MSESEPRPDVTALTVQLLSAYLANNTVASDDLANLIRTTKSALTGNGDTSTALRGEDAFTPAVTMRKSLASPEHILSLIDGKPYKTLKRHLAGHGLTPETYRERYNLPATYPMVAPDFAAKRREIAKQIGLGARRGAQTATSDGAEQPIASAQANSEARPDRNPAGKKNAKLAKPKPAATAPSRSKASPAKSAAAGERASSTATGKSAKTAEPAPKAPAATSKGDVKPPRKVASSAPAQGGSSLEIAHPPRADAKAKRNPGAKAVSASSKPPAPARKTATKPASNLEVKSEPVTEVEGTKSASRPKLGLFRGNAPGIASGGAVPDAIVSTSDVKPGRKTPRTKRMARMPAGSPSE